MSKLSLDDNEEEEEEETAQPLSRRERFVLLIAQKLGRNSQSHPRPILKIERLLPNNKQQPDIKS